MVSIASQYWTTDILQAFIDAKADLEMVDKRVRKVFTFSPRLFLVVSLNYCALRFWVLLNDYTLRMHNPTAKTKEDWENVV